MTDDEGTIADPSAPVSQAQFKALMDSISCISNSTQELKGQFIAFKDDATEQVAKKAKVDKPCEFKKKGNENQFEFTSKIESCFQSIERELEKISTSEERGATALEKAKDSLKEGRELVNERQKLIKLADRSEYGWGVVAEYVADELADDSDDEKRMLKAEKAAERKASKRKRNTNTKYVKGYGSSFKNPSMPNQPQQWLTPRNTRPATISPSTGGYVRPLGPCFACGEVGHLRANCTKTSSTTAKYPNSLEDPSSTCHVVKGHDRDDPCTAGTLGSHCNTCKTSFDRKSEERHDHDNSDRLYICDCIEEGSICLSCTCPSDQLYVHDCPDRLWEVDSCANLTVVKGELRKHYSFWEEILEAPGPILSIIRDGYVLPLMSVPRAFKQCNHSSANANAAFVDEAVRELVQTKCVLKCDDVPHVCSPLLVVSSSNGKKRLVINLRHLNKYLWKEKFKYEDMRTALLYFDRNDYIVTFDLKSGYHHVDIHEKSRKYLGFQWREEYYKFTVLPFGLSSACYIFTKLLRPIIRHWRSQGIKAVIYLDDGIASVPELSMAEKISNILKSTLCQAGFVVHPTKCNWKPSHVGQWLGYNINLHEGLISIPEEKIDRLKLKITEAMRSPCVSARCIASIVGRVLSMGLGIGPICRFRTRCLYAQMNECGSWSDLVSLSSEAIKELNFWLNSIDEFNGQAIWKAPSSVRVVYSDASSTGFGGYVVEHGNYVAHGQWNESEAMESSTWRELKAVQLVLASIAHKLANNNVRWFTDNKNVEHILFVGSKNNKLQLLALEVFKLTRKYCIRLEPEWIPREENLIADYLSRIVDLDDWMLNPEVFKQLDLVWGPHTVDRFANSSNNQVNRFNSRYWNPGSEAIDCFTVNWTGENNWWCPPIGIVLRVIKHASACGCSGTLIVPEWPSAAFWPVLFTGKFFANFVTSIIYLPLREDLFIPGKSGAVLFNGLVPNTNVLALRLSFKDQNV